MKKNLHPSIEQFKQFVKKHPKLIKEVRSGNKTWKDLYQDWYLLGEEDEIWNAYKEEAEPKANQDDSIISKIFSSIKSMDVNEVSQYIANFQEAITAIQNVIGQFQAGNEKNLDAHGGSVNSHPFSFRKD